MVLKVLTDTWKVLHDRDAKSLQLRSVADTGVHEDLRRVHRTQRQHYFDPRTNATGLALVEHPHARRSRALEGQPSDQCVREHRQVRPAHRRTRVRTESGLAL